MSYNINNFMDFVAKEHDNSYIKLKDSLQRLLDGACDDVISFNDLKIHFTYQDSPAIFAHISRKGKIIILDQFQNDIDEVDDIPYSTSTPFKLDSAPKKCGISELDVTGSPLKCDFLPLNESIATNEASFLEIRDSKKQSFHSFDPDVARTLAYHLKSVLEDSDLSKIRCPVLVACDGSDLQKTTFVGISCQENKNLFILVNAEGPFCEPENFSCIDHFSSSMCFGNYSNRIESNVEANYEVLANENGKGSSMQLFSSWRRPQSFFSPPNLDASTVLNIEVVPSDSRCALFKLYSEIELLKNFITGLNSGRMTWIVDNLQFDIDNALNDLFNSINEECTKDIEVCSLDKMIENNFDTIRSNIDFTDLVWSTLKYCDSYQDLSFGLQHIFEAISRGAIRPIFLFRSKTQVGVISRLLMSGQSEIPKLNDSTPLSMLIEIGLEKVKRDYISIFQVGYLATSDVISPFIDWDVSKNDYETYLGNLQQMHIALKVAILMKHHLQLPHPVLIHSVSQVISELMKDDSSKKFSFSLQTSLVDQIYKRLLPQSWNLHLHNKEESGNILDIHLFFSKDPCSILAVPIFSNDNELVKEKKNNDSFFVSTVTVSPSLF